MRLRWLLEAVGAHPDGGWATAAEIGAVRADRKALRVLTLLGHVEVHAVRRGGAFVDGYRLSSKGRELVDRGGDCVPPIHVAPCRCPGMLAELNPTEAS